MKVYPKSLLHLKHQDKKLNLLHMNPGAIGKHGFHKARSVLRFTIDDGKIENLEVIEYKK